MNELFEELKKYIGMQEVVNLMTDVLRNIAGTVWDGGSDSDSKVERIRELLVKWMNDTEEIEQLLKEDAE